MSEPLVGQSERLTFQDLRRLIVFVRLSGEESAQTCAAMLSLLDKDEAAERPVPGYVGLLDRAKALEG